MTNKKTKTKEEELSQRELHEELKKLRLEIASLRQAFNMEVGSLRARIHNLETANPIPVWPQPYPYVPNPWTNPYQNPYQNPNSAPYWLRGPMCGPGKEVTGDTTRG